MPCTADSTFAWGSTTKSMLSTQLLQMVDRGVFRLDDTLVEHANEYLHRISNGTSDLVQLFGPKIANVTLRHLLQMHSGLREFDNEFTRQYQNSHRLEDLSPMWILNNMDRTFECDPGTCGKYSSTNYVLLGLVAARYTDALSWDQLDQRQWMQRIPRHKAEVGPDGTFQSIYYGVHGPLSAFTTADKTQGTGGTSVHGYQPPIMLPQWPDCTNVTDLGCPALDVVSMSSTQGWTCGNLVTRPSAVVDYWWALLGPDRRQYNLLSEATHASLFQFEQADYFSSGYEFGYSLALTNYTSMPGLAGHGEYYGHGGMTYGYACHSGINLKSNFAVKRLPCSRQRERAGRLSKQAIGRPRVIHDLSVVRFRRGSAQCYSGNLGNAARLRFGVCNVCCCCSMHGSTGTRSTTSSGRYPCTMPWQRSLSGIAPSPSRRQWDKKAPVSACLRALKLN